MSCHGPDPSDMLRGAYLLLDPHRGFADCAVIFNEADSDMLRKAALRLSVQGIAARLIAVRDFDVFLQQDEEYRSKLLRTDLKLFAYAGESCSSFSRLNAEMLPCGDEKTIADSIKKLLF